MKIELDSKVLEEHREGIVRVIDKFKVKSISLVEGKE